MKLLGMLFICLLAVVDLRAQDGSANHAPPGLVILKLKWSRELRTPRFWDPSSSYDASTGGSGDLFSRRDRPGMTAPDSPFPPGGRLPYIYEYSAKIRNDGEKQIKGIIWEYVLNEPGSKQELGRHKFFSFEKVGANKSATLHGRSPVSPSKIVSAAGLEKDTRSPYDERVEIMCVSYADGTLWMHPSAKEPECAGLKDREKMKQKMRRR